MTSRPIRDQVEDHLITPKNAALLIIDYQPPQVSSIVSMDHRTLVSNIVATARLAKLYALPIVLSTESAQGPRECADNPPAGRSAGGDRRD
jgi:nicotinamidase-related amidase